MADAAVRIKAREIVADLRAGLDDEALMSKYAISATQLKRLFQKLVDGGFVEQSELNARTEYLTRKKAEAENEAAIQKLIDGDFINQSQLNCGAECLTRKETDNEKEYKSAFSCSKCGRAPGVNLIDGQRFCNNCKPSQLKKEEFACSRCKKEPATNLVGGVRYCNDCLPSHMKTVVPVKANETSKKSAAVKTGGAGGLRIGEGKNPVLALLTRIWNELQPPKAKGQTPVDQSELKARADYLANKNSVAESKTLTLFYLSTIPLGLLTTILLVPYYTSWWIHIVWFFVGLAIFCGVIGVYERVETGEIKPEDFRGQITFLFVIIWSLIGANALTTSWFWFIAVALALLVPFKFVASSVFDLVKTKFQALAALSLIFVIFAGLNAWNTTSRRGSSDEEHATGMPNDSKKVFAKKTDSAIPQVQSTSQVAPNYHSVASRQTGAQKRIDQTDTSPCILLMDLLNKGEAIIDNSHGSDRQRRISDLFIEADSHGKIPKELMSVAKNYLYYYGRQDEFNSPDPIINLDPRIMEHRQNYRLGLLNDKKRIFEECTGKNSESRKLPDAGIAAGSGSTENLMRASAHGDLDEVKKLLAQGINVNARHTNAMTALMFASGKGHQDIAKFLLEKGADVNAKDDAGFTALMAASVAGQVSIVDLLLQKRADVNAKATKGNTALMMACTHGHLDVVKLLLQKGADVNAKNGDITALMLAAAKGHSKIVELLRAHGALEKAEEQSQTKANEHDDLTAFLQACAQGKMETVRSFLGKGGNVNAQDKNGGHSGLKLASNFGRVPIMQLLLAKGAAVNITDDHGATPLYYASGKGDLDAVKLLLEKGADLNAKDTTGTTALMLSLLEGHQEIAKLLVVRGADVNAKRQDGITALMMASGEGHIAIVQLLLQKGANVNARMVGDATALVAASAKGHSKIVELLKAHGARE